MGAKVTILGHRFIMPKGIRKVPTVKSDRLRAARAKFAVKAHSCKGKSKAEFRDCMRR